MLSTFFSCYLWWFLAGALLGWLLNWWLCRCSCKKDEPAVKPSAPGINAYKSSSTPLPSLAQDKAVTSPVIDIAAAKLAGITVKGADDLEVIEGIGPKIAGLFHAAGFATFAQVAKMSIAQMSQILDDAGPRFKLANPETWAQQADLAAHNRWSELKTLQDNLTAGVTVQQDRHEL